MKRHIAAALAAVAFAAAGAALACEYSTTNDAAAAAPADVVKVPAVASCEGTGCSMKPEKVRTSTKSTKLVVAATRTSAAAQNQTVH